MKQMNDEWIALWKTKSHAHSFNQTALLAKDLPKAHILYRIWKHFLCSSLWKQFSSGIIELLLLASLNFGYIQWVQSQRPLMMICLFCICFEFHRHFFITNDNIGLAILRNKKNADKQIFLESIWLFLLALMTACTQAVWTKLYKTWAIFDV